MLCKGRAHEHRIPPCALLYPHDSPPDLPLLDGPEFGIMRRNVIDRLALLCTLHADGPRTLRLLREAGCTNIEKLAELSADKIGKVLGLPAAAARRLTREAGRLHERLEPDLEQEELTYPAAAEARGIKPPPPSFRLDEPSFERSTPSARLGLRDQELMQRVVERWRSEDQPEDGVEPEALEELFLQPAEPDPQGLRIVELSASEREALKPTVADVPLLQAGDLDGLDPETCRLLLAAEVRSLEELATCPADELSVRSGLPFTKARTLQFRAGKRLAEIASDLVANGGAVAEEERISPSERPLPLAEPESTPEKVTGLMWDDSGAAGPFA